MENQLHPELASQIGMEQQNKKYDVHPSLIIEQEVAPEQPPIEQQVQDPEEPVAVPVVEQQVQPAPAETPQDRDWRAMRQRAEEARQLAREKEALERERDFYRQQALKQTTQPQQDDFRTDTEKQLAHEMEQLRAQVAQQARETAEAQRRAATWRAEADLAREYNDFSKVVSKENVDRLEREYPHLFAAATSTSDVYAAGSAAYELIKAKGIYKDQGQSLRQMAQSDTIARNLSKPRSSSSIYPQAGESPIKQANVYQSNTISTDDERKALYAEMLAASRNKY